MKIEVEHTPNIPGVSKGIVVRLTRRGNDGLLTLYRHSTLDYLKDGSFVVSYFTPSGTYFREKLFPKEKYETAWRFMWRTAIGERG